jgi:hypothetical protein
MIASISVWDICSNGIAMQLFETKIFLAVVFFAECSQLRRAGRMA